VDPAPPPDVKRSIGARVFLSPEERRLRAGWRLSIQFLLMGILLAIMLVPLAVATEVASPGWMERNGFLASEIAMLFATTISVFLARRFLDRRSFGSMGLRLGRKAVTDVFTGILITGLMMGLIFLLMSAADWLKVEGFAWQSDPPRIVLKGVLEFGLLFVLVGWNEELLFRGYQLQSLASGTNLLWGVVLSSLLFGAAHLGNPGAGNVGGVLLGITLAGLFMAYAYTRTRSLWLSIGIHVGWNFFEGVVFGFPVSGLDIYRLTHVQVTGPELWTGGSFGPEAGLILLPAMCLGFALVHIYSSRSRMDVT